MPQEVGINFFEEKQVKEQEKLTLEIKSHAFRKEFSIEQLKPAEIDSDDSDYEQDDIDIHDHDQGQQTLLNEPDQSVSRSIDVQIGLPSFAKSSKV